MSWQNMWIKLATKKSDLGMFSWKYVEREPRFRFECVSLPQRIETKCQLAKTQWRGIGLSIVFSPIPTGTTLQNRYTNRSIGHAPMLPWEWFRRTSRPWRKNSGRNWYAMLVEREVFGMQISRSPCFTKNSPAMKKRSSEKCSEALDSSMG